MRKLDYHVHSTHSPDGMSSLQLTVESAVLRGFEEIAITEHFELDNWADIHYNPTKFFEEFAQLAEAYQGKITLRAGIELGSPFENPSLFNELLSQYPYDFVLASCHACPEDVSKINYSKPGDAMKRYFETLHKIINFGNFDSLAHLDLPKRYAHIQGVKLNFYRDYFDELQELLKHLAEAEKALEFNISGLRTQMAESMPSEDVIELWKNFSRPLITIGTDSHHADDVGKFVEEAVDMLRTHNVTEIATFQRRKLIIQPLDFDFSHLTDDF